MWASFSLYIGTSIVYFYRAILYMLVIIISTLNYKNLFN